MKTDLYKTISVLLEEMYPKVNNLWEAKPVGKTEPAPEVQDQKFFDTNSGAVKDANGVFANLDGMLTAAKTEKNTAPAPGTPTPGEDSIYDKDADATDLPGGGTPGDQSAPSNTQEAEAQGMSFGNPLRGNGETVFYMTHTGNASNMNIEKFERFIAYWKDKQAAEGDEDRTEGSEKFADENGNTMDASGNPESSEDIVKRQQDQQLDTSIEGAKARILEDVESNRETLEAAGLDVDEINQSVENIMNDGLKAHRSQWQKFISMIKGEEDKPEEVQKAFQELSGDIGTTIRAASKMLREEGPTSFESLSQAEKDSLSRIVMKSNKTNIFWMGDSQTTLVQGAFNQGGYGVKIDSPAGGLYKLIDSLKNLKDENGNSVIRVGRSDNPDATARAVLGTFQEHMMVAVRGYRNGDLKAIKKAMVKVTKQLGKKDAAALTAVMKYAAQGGLGGDFQNPDDQESDAMCLAAAEDLGPGVVDNQKQFFAWLAAATIATVAAQDEIMERLCPDMKPKQVGTGEGGIVGDGSRQSADVEYCGSKKGADSCQGKLDGFLDSAHGGGDFNQGRKGETNCVKVQSKVSFTAGGNTIMGSQVQEGFHNGTDNNEGTAQLAGEYLTKVSAQSGGDIDDDIADQIQAEFEEEGSQVEGILNSLKKVGKSGETALKNKINGAGTVQEIELWKAILGDAKDLSHKDPEKAQAAEKSARAKIAQAHRIGLENKHPKRYNALMAGHVQRVGMPTDAQVFVKTDLSGGITDAPTRIGNEQNMIGQISYQIASGEAKYHHTATGTKILLKNPETGKYEQAADLASRSRSGRNSQDMLGLTPSFVDSNTMPIEESGGHIPKETNEALVRQAFNIMLEILEKSEHSLV
tara:strand:+ start:108 stop:2705 length:2598 start_codon:yes stop_codon:yes gene_type:complete